MSKTDEQLSCKAKDAFDASVDSLDAATLSRLNRGRQAALAETARPNLQWLRWMPATGFAVAVLMAVMVLRGPGDIDVISAPTTDFEILLSEESIEMLEDLEFYSWLATQELDSEGDLG
ncbi:MAG: hypothetical protein HQ492_01420 [Woeseiaceae bacterium]|nr:hypothetical protein [Woeseiaceae bacterium]